MQFKNFMNGREMLHASRDVAQQKLSLLRVFFGSMSVPFGGFFNTTSQIRDY